MGDGRWWGRGRAVLLEEERQMTDKEGPAVLPLTLHLSFLFSAACLSVLPLGHCHRPEEEPMEEEPPL